MAMGSIGGGGRYDDLTGDFRIEKYVGCRDFIWFRPIALVMEEVGLFPEAVLATSKALFLNFGDKEALYAMKAIGKLRQKESKLSYILINQKLISNSNMLIEEEFHLP